MSQRKSKHPADPNWNRRELLLRGGAGFGGVVLSHLLAAESAAGPSHRTATANDAARLAVQRARQVIFVFLEGGPSHIDLFDPKPRLTELAGKPLPDSFGPVITPMGEYDAPLLASKRTFRQYGQAGIWVSDWLPHIAGCVDDLCVIRSCWGDGLNHSNGVCQMNTGSIFAGRPSLGAWVSYGLGTENENLPAFIVLEDNPGKVINGPRNWSAGFMPAAYQGTAVRAGSEPISNLDRPKSVSDQRQKRKMELLGQIDREHQRLHPHDENLEARIRSYELAYRMQAAAPETVDLSRETAQTQALYGIDEKPTAEFGRQCLLARRLVERGVRFVQLYHGSGSRWDAHSQIEKNHSELCRASDKPVAGLLTDLKQRGLLDETLVIWGGEFGRTPMSEKGDGRDHNPYGFTMWMAGGGVKRGAVIGSTDEIGLHAVKDRLHVHDLHATILHLLGVDPQRLTYLHKGRPERATQNEGEVCHKILDA